jgi:hypothetical protein
LDSRAQLLRGKKLSDPSLAGLLVLCAKSPTCGKREPKTPFTTFGPRQLACTIIRNS